MANQCRAWSEALDPFEYSLSTHSDAATGASQMATAMRADLFDIDCAFYIAGPAALCRRCVPIWRCGRRAGESQLHSEVIGMSCTCKDPTRPAADDDGCSGGESFALRVLGDDMRPSSTTATSSSSSQMARCTTAASCWPATATAGLLRQLVRHETIGWWLHA
jgi:hypothetical protein